MSKELVTAAESISNERQLPIDYVFSALEEGLTVATRRLFDNDRLFRVQLDRKTGDISLFRLFKVVEEVISPSKEISFEAAHYDDKNVQLGSYIEDEEDSSIITLDRITMQTVRQVMLSKLRDFEKEQNAEKFQQHIGTIVNGIVKKSTPTAIYVDLGDNTEGVLTKEHIIFSDRFRAGDNIRALLLEIKYDIKDGVKKNPRIILSRTSNKFLEQLLNIEVPEINEGTISIVSSARDVGHRAKVAVKSNNKKIDVIGACIGMRGQRINAVSKEIGNERIDIVLWNDDLAYFTYNALSPAEIKTININEAENVIYAAVSQDNLSQAIGQNGKNARLAGQLIGWPIQILTEEEFDLRRQEEDNKKINYFVEKLDIDEESGTYLVEEGFNNLEELAFADLEELEELFGEQAETLRALAYEALNKQQEENTKLIEESNVEQALKDLEGITDEILVVLINKGATTLENLADLGVDEVSDSKLLSEKAWGDLIMQARNICWFNE